MSGCFLQTECLARYAHPRRMSFLQREGRAHAHVSVDFVKQFGCRAAPLRYLQLLGAIRMDLSGVII